MGMVFKTALLDSPAKGIKRCNSEAVLTDSGIVSVFPFVKR